MLILPRRLIASIPILLLTATLLFIGCDAAGTAPEVSEEEQEEEPSEPVSPRTRAAIIKKFTRPHNAESYERISHVRISYDDDARTETHRTQSYRWSETKSFERIIQKNEQGYMTQSDQWRTDRGRREKSYRHRVLDTDERGRPATVVQSYWRDDAWIPTVKSIYTYPDTATAHFKTARKYTYDRYDRYTSLEWILERETTIHERHEGMLVAASMKSWNMDEEAFTYFVETNVTKRSGNQVLQVQDVNMDGELIYTANFTYRNNGQPTSKTVLSAGPENDARDSYVYEDEMPGWEPNKRLTRTQSVPFAFFERPVRPPVAPLEPGR